MQSRSSFNARARNPSFRYNTSTKQPYKASRQSGKFSHRFVAVIIVICLTGGWLLKIAADAEAAVLDTENSIIAAEIIGPFKPKPKIDQARLESEIGQLISSNSGLDISVSYRDLTTNKQLHYGNSDAYGAASVTKLITAIYYLNQVDAGKRSLSDAVGGRTAQEQIRLLIEISDNAAWELLDGVLGGGNLESYASSVGLKQFDHNINRVSADDIALLLEKLYRGQLLTESNTNLLLGHLKKANYRQYIVAAVPSSSDIYHKVGYLGDRVHDAAIIDNQKFPYVLVVFTKSKSGGYDFISGGNLIKAITKSVQKTYDQN